MKERTLRFSGLEWYELVQNKKILIVGAGGIGSWCTLFLSRILEKTPIYVMDYDIVEEHNIGGQFFDSFNVGSLKVAALQRQITGHYGGMVSVVNDRFTKNTGLTDVNFIISAVDNMRTRKVIFDKIVEKLNTTGKLTHLIDGRLLAESYQIFSVYNSNDFEQYKATLFNDEEAPTMACSTKATTHCGAAIAADITGILLNMVTNDHYKDNRREVPFMISKYFDLMMYDTKIPEIFQTERV